MTEQMTKGYPQYLLLGAILVCLGILANCGKKSDSPTGNSSSYPGNFIALCNAQEEEQTPELIKTFKALRETPEESCLDAYSRLMALDEIDLSGKDISDIRPLASFVAVKTLYLDHNRISSVAALAGLFKLEKLDVSWNDISEVSELTELARLETLYMFGNPLGNDIAKTADNCPYSDVGKGLRAFCEPPVAKNKNKKKRSRVIVIKNPTNTTDSKNKSKNKTKSDDPEESSSNPSSDSNSDSTAEDSSSTQQDSNTSSSDSSSSNSSSSDSSSSDRSPSAENSTKPDRQTDNSQADNTETDRTKRKRAWEKDTSFLPPEDDENDDDYDDWGTDTDERGLTSNEEDTAKSTPAKGSVDEAIAKEIEKGVGTAANKATANNPFAQDTSGGPKAPISSDGEQTTAHSWDQAVGITFDQSHNKGQGLSPASEDATSAFGPSIGGPNNGGPNNGGLSIDDADKGHELNFGLKKGSLGELSLSERVPAETIFGDDNAAVDQHSAVAQESDGSQPAKPDFWSTALLKRLSLGLAGSSTNPVTSASDGSQNKETLAGRTNPPAKATPKKSTAKNGLPTTKAARGWRIAAKPTRKGKAPLKSFLAYCLDHSDQPAIAHTIKVLTKTGESCLDSYRRLSATESLNLSGKGLADVSPLASFKNLRKLDLSDNSIADLRPIAGLSQLTYLNLDRNKLGDIAHLGKLAALSHLTAQHNRIFSLSPLSQLKNLGTLAIKGNPIAKDAAKNSRTCPQSARNSSLKSLCKF